MHHSLSTWPHLIRKRKVKKEEIARKFTSHVLLAAAAAAAKSLQSCLTLCDPMDYTIRGIFQTKILEWVAFPFSGDLPNLGIKPGSSALQTDVYCLSH